MCEYSDAAQRTMLRYIAMGGQLKSLREIPSSVSQWVASITAADAIASSSVSARQCGHT